MPKQLSRALKTPNISLFSFKRNLSQTSNHFWILISIVLTLSSFGVCYEKVGDLTLSHPLYGPRIYETETGFIGGGGRIAKSVLRSDNNYDKESYGGSGGGSLKEGEKDESDIWRDENNVCTCWNSSDGGRVREVECKCLGIVENLSSTLPNDVHRIVIKDGPNFTVLKNEDLRAYKNSLKEISLADLPNFKGIENGTFNGMINLDTIYILEMPSLSNLSSDVFNDYIPSLKTIRISHTALRTVPNLSRIRLLKADNHLELLDLENNQISEIVDGWLENVRINYLSLSYNHLKEIGPHAFSGASISKLKLKGNKELSILHPDAFVGMKHLNELDLSETSITHLPTLGLKSIHFLRLQNVLTLRIIPSIYNFDELKEAWLTFPYHCCAFEFPETHNPSEHTKFKNFIKKLEESGCGDKSEKKEQRNDSSTLPTRKKREKSSTSSKGSGISFDPYVFELDKSFVDDLELSDDKRGEDERDEFGTFHSEVSHETSVLHHHCGEVAKKKTLVLCTPLPDAFSPCEDIMGNIWLRTAVWIVVTLALVGNSAVLVVLILAPGRMSVQRFLMANLSLADLSMGIYLLLVATQDLVSLGSYFNYAIQWQMGWGCAVAGFFTVFASELSVFTLAVITGERWYALTRALHLTKRLTLSKAAQLMSIGWFCALLLAALPLIGVSSYSKTSICLPMEASDVGAQIYLAFLLIFNGVAFSLVAYAYYQMYRAVSGHGNGGPPAAAHAADAAIAKKMALLVFTDFACWAPVAFFGLTAVAGKPLIGVTDSKILLVFFYPLNACCNPYLYAILTKQYRRDLLLLLSRHGICTKRASRYKTGQTGSTNITMQTILRLGSIPEGKVNNGRSSSTSSSVYNPPKNEAKKEEKGQKISVSSILSIAEEDEIETSFVKPSSSNINKTKRLESTVESIGEFDEDCENTPFCP